MWSGLGRSRARAGRAAMPRAKRVADNVCSWVFRALTPRPLSQAAGASFWERGATPLRSPFPQQSACTLGEGARGRGRAGQVLSRTCSFWKTAVA